jgi:hypothetical protein
MLEIIAVGLECYSLDDVKSCNTIRICYYKYNAYYSKGASVK